MPRAKKQPWCTRMRAAMSARGMSAADLAVKLMDAGYREKLAPSTVRNWINGSYPINLEDFFRICELLDVSPLAVLFGEDYETDFLELAEIWRQADSAGRKAIQLAVKVAREHARSTSGGGVIPFERT